jgi:hypothetical protein
MYLSKASEPAKKQFYCHKIISGTRVFFYYSLFPDNKIEIFNDYDCEQAIIYY